jgi:F-type H+-transporting ATPase subunit b
VNFNATLIGQSIAFAVYVWFVMKYVWPMLSKMLEERKAKIADGLAAAEKGQHELELAEQRSTQILKESKEQALEVISNAQKRADEIVEEAKGNARVEGERIIGAAKAEIEQEVQQAREGLRQEVSSLAVTGAEQILMREVDTNTHKDVLAKLSAQL